MRNKKYLKTNANRNTAYHNLWEEAKVVLEPGFEGVDRQRLEERKEKGTWGGGTALSQV